MYMACLKGNAMDHWPHPLNHTLSGVCRVTATYLILIGDVEDVRLWEAGLESDGAQAAHAAVVLVDTWKLLLLLRAGHGVVPPKLAGAAGERKEELWVR